jgi:hypothetical protein
VPCHFRRLLIVGSVVSVLAAWRNRMLAANEAVYLAAQRSPAK